MLTITTIQSETHLDGPEPGGILKVSFVLDEAQPIRYADSLKPHAEMTGGTATVYRDLGEEYPSMGAAYVSAEGYGLTQKGTRDKRQKSPNYLSLPGTATKWVDETLKVALDAALAEATA